MSAAEKFPLPATLEDLLALPDQGQGWEIIDGELAEKETSGEHSQAQSRLGRLLGPYDRRPGGADRPGGWWFATECLVDFRPDPLRPDVAGWRRDRLPDGPRGVLVKVVPDWICEILSPGNSQNDTVRKKRIYYRHRLQHYWLIDPVAQTLQVLRWMPDGYTEVLSAVRGEKVRAEPFDAIELFVGVLFGDDEE